MNSAFGQLAAVALMASLTAAFPALCDDAVSAPSSTLSTAEHTEYAESYPNLIPRAVPRAGSSVETARLARRTALIAELLNEGADREAVAEAALLRADFPDAAESALAPLRPRIALSSGAEAPKTASSGGGLGGWLARRVVGFYRTFVGPAIGNRCALEPSCSRYCLQATRKHGLLGIPMTADRFVREPVASAPDRPVVRNAAGEWRHPDSVEDHDFWFSTTDNSHR